MRKNPRRILSATGAFLQAHANQRPLLKIQGLRKLAYLFLPVAFLCVPIHKRK